MDTLHKIIQKGVRILTFVYFDLSSSTLEIINQIVTEHWSTQEYFFPPTSFFWGGGGRGKVCFGYGKLS